MEGRTERSSEVYRAWTNCENRKLNKYLQLIAVLKKHNVRFTHEEVLSVVHYALPSFTSFPFFPLQINLGFSLQSSQVSGGQKVKDKLVTDKSRVAGESRNHLIGLLFSLFWCDRWVLPARPRRQTSHWCALHPIHKSWDTEWVRQSVGKTVSDGR